MQIIKGVDLGVDDREMSHLAEPNVTVLKEKILIHINCLKN